MMKVTRLLIITVCTAVALAVWQLFIHPLLPAFQWIFFAALVFLVGVPHGALDLYVQQRSDQLSGRKSHILFFLFKYCSLILLYAGAWYLFPAMAFILFLIISCLHFGETDLTFFTFAFTGKKVLAFLYGAALLLILLLPHSKEVGVVLQQLLPGYWQLPICLSFMQLHTPVMISLSCLIMVTIVATQVFKRNVQRVTVAPLLLAVLLGCCSALPLLPAFALYFVGWHSIISLHQIGRYIKNGNTKYANQNFVLPLLIKGFPFSLFAMAGLSVACFLIQHYSLSFKPLPLVLIFLSLITLPHLQVMNELNKRLPLSK